MMTEKTEKTGEREVDIFSPHFAEMAGRKPVSVWYTHQPKCPKCGDTLENVFIKANWFPYQHVDFMMRCITCGAELLFGIPQSRDSGLSMIVWDTNPFEAVQLFSTLKTPTCQYTQHGPMMPTKIFGDWFEKFYDNMRFQWKCSTCYMVRQISVLRSIPRGYNDPLTDGEKKALEEKLERMGYI